MELTTTDQKQLEVLQQDINKFDSWVTPITDRESLKNAGDNLKGIKVKIKEIEAAKEKLVKPVWDHLQDLRAIFKPFEAKAEQIKKQLESNILTYQREQVRLQREEEERQRKIELERLEAQRKALEDEAAKNNSEVVLDAAIEIEEKMERVETAPSEITQNFKGGWATTKIKENWTYRIVNPDKVPAQFCSPDHAKIMAAIRAGSREIEGLEIYDKGTLVSN